MASTVDLEQFLIDIANAIRYREASSEIIMAGDYDTRIKHLPSLTVLQYNVPPVAKGESDQYGFTLTADGYYTAQNAGINSSYAYAVVYFELTSVQDVTFTCINNAKDDTTNESHYDYMLLSTLNTELAHNNSDITTNVYKTFKGESSTSAVSVTYASVPAGIHFITIKARKDNVVSTTNDIFKFKSSVIGANTITMDYRIFAYQTLADLQAETKMMNGDLAVVYSTTDESMLYQCKTDKWEPIINTVMTQDEYDYLEDVATLIRTEREVDAE